MMALKLNASMILEHVYKVISIMVKKKDAYQIQEIVPQDISITEVEKNALTIPINALLHNTSAMVWAQDASQIQKTVPLDGLMTVQKRIALMIHNYAYKSTLMMALMKNASQVQRSACNLMLEMPPSQDVSSMYP